MRPRSRARSRTVEGVNPWPTYVNSITVAGFLFLITFALGMDWVNRLSAEVDALKAGKPYIDIIDEFDIDSEEELRRRLQWVQDYQEEHDQAKEDAEAFAQVLREETTFGGERQGTKVVVRLGADLTFDVNRSVMKSKEAAQGLREFARELSARLPDERFERIAYIDIEGHTDPSPFAGKVFTNWDLSSQRAATIVKFLEDSCSVPGSKLRAAGRSYHRLADPVNPFSEVNRRVELTIEFFQPKSIGEQSTLRGE